MHVTNGRVTRQRVRHSARDVEARSEAKKVAHDFGAELCAGESRPLLPTCEILAGGIPGYSADLSHFHSLPTLLTSCRQHRRASIRPSCRKGKSDEVPLLCACSQMYMIEDLHSQRTPGACFHNLPKVCTHASNYP